MPFDFCSELTLFIHKFQYKIGFIVKSKGILKNFILKQIDRLTSVFLFEWEKSINYLALFTISQNYPKVVNKVEAAGVIKLLLEYGADPNYLDSMFHIQNTIIASYNQVFQKL
jgi:hypothetical protein